MVLTVSLHFPLFKIAQMDSQDIPKNYKISVKISVDFIFYFPVFGDKKVENLGGRMLPQKPEIYVSVSKAHFTEVGLPEKDGKK